MYLTLARRPTARGRVRREPQLAGLRATLRESALSAEQRRRWQQHFADALAHVAAPPSRLRLRVGQGVHLLLGDEPPFDVVLAPADHPHPAWHRSPTTSVRYLGADALDAARTAWLEAIGAALPEDDPSWPSFLQDAAEAKGISVAASRRDDPITSGEELVIRLLEPCNARCDFCACIGVMEDAAHDASLVRQQLEAGIVRGHHTVAFTGGEPTLLPQLVDHVAAARALGFRTIVLQTNGTRLAEGDLAGRLARAGLDRVLLSLHSHLPDVHDAVLRLPGAFDAAVAGIEAAVQAGVRVRLNFVLHRENMTSVADYVTWVWRRFDRALTRSWHGHVGITVSFVSPIGWTLEHLEMVPTITEAAPHLARALAVADGLGLDVHVPGLCGLPLCTMPGWETFLAEHDGGSPPRLDTRRYVAACDGCGWRSRCSGYWSTYLDMHGEHELGPGVPRPWARPPEPALAAALRDALTRLARAGHTASRIADALNARQVRTPRGGRWTDGQVRRTLEGIGVAVTTDAEPER